MGVSQCKADADVDESKFTKGTTVKAGVFGHGTVSISPRLEDGMMKIELPYGYVYMQKEQVTILNESKFTKGTTVKAGVFGHGTVSISPRLKDGMMKIELPYGYVYMQKEQVTILNEPNNNDTKEIIVDGIRYPSIFYTKNKLQHKEHYNNFC